MHRTDETTKLDVVLLWGWTKWEWPFKRGPLRKMINQIFWFHDMAYNKPKDLVQEEEVKHWHAVVRKRKCPFCNTPDDVLTGEHPTVEVNA